MRVVFGTYDISLSNKEMVNKCDINKQVLQKLMRFHEISHESTKH